MSDQATSIIGVMLFIILVCLGLGAIVWHIFSCEEQVRTGGKPNKHEEKNRTGA